MVLFIVRLVQFVGACVVDKICVLNIVLVNRIRSRYSEIPKHFILMKEMVPISNNNSCENNDAC